MNLFVAKARRGIGALYKSSHQARWAMAGQIVTSGANFATTIIIVNSLGLEEFGRFSMCFLLIMITRNFLNGLVLTPMASIAPKLSPVSIPAYRGFLALNGLVFVAISSVILLIGSAPLGVALNALWLQSLALPLVIASVAANGADFLKRYHYVYVNPARAFWVDASRFSVQIGILLLLAFPFRAVFSPQNALYAIAIGGLVGFLVGVFQFGALDWSNRFSAAAWPRHKNFIKWMTPSIIVETVQSNGPMLVGLAVFGDAALGLIRTVQSLANALDVPFNGLAQVLPTLASRAYTDGSKRAMSSLLWTSFLYASMAFFALFAVVFLNFQSVSNLMNINGLEQALVLFLVFVTFNYSRLCRLHLSSGFFALELPDVTFRENLLGMIVSVGILVLAVATHTLIFIPVALAVSGLASAAYLAAVAMREGKRPFVLSVFSSKRARK